MPACIVELFQGYSAGNPGVADENLEWYSRRFDLLNERFNLKAIANIEEPVLSRSSGFDYNLRRVSAFSFQNVCDHDMIAGSTKDEGGGPADADAAAADERR